MASLDSSKPHSKRQRNSEKAASEVAAKRQHAASASSSSSDGRASPANATLASGAAPPLSPASVVAAPSTSIGHLSIADQLALVQEEIRVTNNSIRKIEPQIDEIKVEIKAVEQALLNPHLNEGDRTRLLDKEKRLGVDKNTLDTRLLQLGEEKKQLHDEKIELLKRLPGVTPAAPAPVPPAAPAPVPPAAPPPATLEEIIQMLQSLPDNSASTPATSNPNSVFLGEEQAVANLWQLILRSFRERQRGALTVRPKPFVIISGNLSGMGKTTFGLQALDLLKQHVISHPECERLSPTISNLELLDNSVHIFINCNSGNDGDNYLSPDCDFDVAAQWIAFRLLWRALSSCPLQQVLPSLLTVDLQRRFKSRPAEVLSWIGQRQRGTRTGQPELMIFVHFDEYPFLVKAKGFEFAAAVVKELVSCTNQLFDQSIYLVAFLTATIQPSMRFTQRTSMNPVYLSLELLDPAVVLNYLLSAFPEHTLLAGAAEHNSAARRWWWILLHDIGVVPVLFAEIVEVLKNSFASKDSLCTSIEDVVARKAPSLEWNSDVSRVLLRHVLTSQPIYLDTQLSAKTTLRDLTEDGSILFDATIDPGKVIVKFPLVFLKRLLSDSKYRDLVLFPYPAAGIPFEKMVFLTLLARMEFCIPANVGEVPLADVFKGISSLKTSASSIIEIQVPDHPQFKNLPYCLEDLEKIPINLGCIYALPRGYPGFDGVVRFITPIGKHLWVLLQVKSSDSGKAAGKSGKNAFMSAIRRFQQFRLAHPDDQAILVFVSQQRIPGSLVKDPEFPADDSVFAITGDGLSQFSLPGLVHRFQIE
jgi:hypothetical protein